MPQNDSTSALRPAARAGGTQSRADAARHHLGRDVDPYLLWHRLMEPQFHRPAPDKVLAAALTELQEPSMFAFTAGVLLGRTPPWSVDDLCDLAEQRYEDMRRRQPVELPPRVDAALWALVAQRLRDDGAPTTLVCAAIDRAVKCSPGDKDVMELEQRFAAGQLDDFDLQALILGRAPLKHSGTP